MRAHRASEIQRAIVRSRLFPAAPCHVAWPLRRHALPPVTRELILAASHERLRCGHPRRVLPRAADVAPPAHGGPTPLRGAARQSGHFRLTLPATLERPRAWR